MIILLHLVLKHLTYNTTWYCMVDKLQLRGRLCYFLRYAADNGSITIDPNHFVTLLMDVRCVVYLRAAFFFSVKLNKSHGKE